MRARTGDVFFTHSDSLLGGLIRWAETDPGESPAWTNHCGVVIADGLLAGPGLGPDAIVVEALWKTRKGPLDFSKGIEARVFRPVPEYTEEEKRRFVVDAEEFVGDGYGWWKLIFQLADRVFFGGKKVFCHLLCVDKRPICSYLAAKVHDAARKIGTVVHDEERLPLPMVWQGFGMDPETADPDSMLRWCEAHPEFWEEIR